MWPRSQLLSGVYTCHVVRSDKLWDAEGRSQREGAMPRSRHVLPPAAGRRLLLPTAHRRRVASDAAARGRAASTCSAASAAAEVTRLFDEEIRDEPPRLLQAFLAVQQLRGFTALAPDDTSAVTAGLGMRPPPARTSTCG